MSTKVNNSAAFDRNTEQMDDAEFLRLAEQAGFVVSDGCITLRRFTPGAGECDCAYEPLRRFAELMEEAERRQHGNLTLCDPVIAAELDAERRNLTPAKARAFLMSAGIMNKHGKLAERYGGEPEGEDR